MCIDFDLQNRLDQFYFGFLLKWDVEKLETERESIISELKSSVFWNACSSVSVCVRRHECSCFFLPLAFFSCILYVHVFVFVDVYMSYMYDIYKLYVCDKQCLKSTPELVCVLQICHECVTNIVLCHMCVTKGVFKHTHEP